MRLLRLAAVILVGGGITSVSPGADDGTPQGVVAHTTSAPPPLWSGRYLGQRGDYGSARASTTPFDGMLGGLQIGYNAQRARNLILGVEADVSSADISRTDTGGFAWAVDGVSASDTKAHAAGVEWVITPAWTAQAEYLYAHFGNQGYFGGPAATGSVDADTMRFAANYLVR